MVTAQKSNQDELVDAVNDGSTNGDGGSSGGAADAAAKKGKDSQQQQQQQPASKQQEKEAEDEAGDGKKKKDDKKNKKKKKEKTWLGTLLDGSMLGLLLTVLYLYTTVKSMTAMMFPLRGLEIPDDTPRIRALWDDSDELQIFAYLSTSAKPSPRAAFNGSASHPLIWDTTHAWSSSPPSKDGKGQGHAAIDPPTTGGSSSSSSTGKGGKGREVLRYGWETASPEARLELLSNDERGVAAAAAARERLRSKRAEEESAGGSVIFMAAKFLFDVS